MAGDNRLPAESPLTEAKPVLTDAGRWLVLGTAFLGWFFAGVLMSTTSLAMRSAALDLLDRAGTIDLAHFQALNEALQKYPGRAEPEKVLPPDDAAHLKAWRAAAQQWFAWYQCAFLFGAATGGLVFGRIGDRIGRSPAMAASILCFSLLSGAAALAQAPEQLLMLWFLTGLGVGGMWPNGVALLAETWPNLSRPLVAGVMGTSANVGIFAMATLATHVSITPADWRWVMILGASPVLLGLFVWAAVPESPRWLAVRERQDATGVTAAPVALVFRPPFLTVTLVGILLATIPLAGAWGSANWMIPWAEEAGETARPPDPNLKARLHQARSLMGIAGSLLGGWIGHVLGRRRAYCLVSLAALFCAQVAFWLLVPTDGSFLFWAAALGFFSGIFFGWLPLFLPELFPTAVRSTGAGVSFNFGRILTVVTVFATAELAAAFNKDYAAIGRVTSLVYLLGAAAIWLAPDTTRRQLED